MKPLLPFYQIFEPYKAKMVVSKEKVVEIEALGKLIKERRDGKN